MVSQVTTHKYSPAHETVRKVQVIFKVKDREVARTKLVCPSLKDKTLTPSWNEELEIDVDPNAPFAVGVYRTLIR